MPNNLIPVFNFFKNRNRRILRITDRNGNYISFSYDTADLLKLLTVKDGANPNRSITFGYNTNGTIKTVTDPANRVTNYTYDANGDLTNITGPGGYTAAYIYDAHKITSKTDPHSPKGYTKGTFEYYPDGKVHIARDGFGKPSTTLIYGQMSYETTITDARGNIEIHEYDIQGRNISVTDADGNVTRYTWDDNLNRTSSAKKNMESASTKSKI